MTTPLRYSLLAMAAIVLVFYNPLIHIAAGYNREIAVSGTVIYGALRSISSVMSIVRDADVEASIGVASIATSPGQALQPVIVTVERMSNMLFALVVASGVLGFTLPIVASLGALLLAIGASTNAIASVIRRPLTGNVDSLARAAIRLGVIAAVCVPMAYAIAFFVGDRYTADAWNRAANIFETRADTLSVDKATEESVAPEPSAESEPKVASGGNLLDWFKSKVDDAIKGSGEAVQGALEATTGLATAVQEQFNATAGVVTDGLAMAADLFQSSVDISVAYLVKLIVLPILLLVGTIWLFRSLTHSGAGAQNQRNIASPPQ